MPAAPGASRASCGIFSLRIGSKFKCAKASSLLTLAVRGMFTPSDGKGASVRLRGVSGLELCREPLVEPIRNCWADAPPSSARAGEEGNTEEEDPLTITTLTSLSTSSSGALVFGVVESGAPGGANGPPLTLPLLSGMPGGIDGEPLCPGAPPVVATASVGGTPENEY